MEEGSAVLAEAELACELALRGCVTGISRPSGSGPLPRLSRGQPGPRAIPAGCRPRLVPLSKRPPVSSAPIDFTFDVIRKLSNRSPCGILCAGRKAAKRSNVQEPSQEHC
jgi:hypothetical protein